MIYVVGSSGGNGPSASDAILTVTAPTGSTVTATKGGVTLTPTMWVQAADATQDCALFVISPSLFDSQNAWTVTATLGTDSASDTVTIDSNKQYDVELTYGYYLYKDGDEYTAATGGWKYDVVGTAGTYTNDITLGAMHVIHTNTINSGFLQTVNKINLTGYSALVARIKLISRNQNGYLRLAVTSANGYNANPVAYSEVDVSQSYIDVSMPLEYSSTYYVGLKGNLNLEYYVKAVWLKR